MRSHDSPPKHAENDDTACIGPSSNIPRRHNLITQKFQQVWAENLDSLLQTQQSSHVCKAIVHRSQGNCIVIITTWSTGYHHLT